MSYTGQEVDEPDLQTGDQGGLKGRDEAGRIVGPGSLSRPGVGQEREAHQRQPEHLY
jgi:hypothetical protein